MITTIKCKKNTILLIDNLTHITDIRETKCGATAPVKTKTVIKINNFNLYRLENNLSTKEMYTLIITYAMKIKTPFLSA